MLVWHPLYHPPGAENTNVGSGKNLRKRADRRAGGSGCSGPLLTKIKQDILNRFSGGIDLFTAGSNARRMLCRRSSWAWR